LGKNLRGVSDGGGLIRFFEANDANAEAEFVCREIADALREDSSKRIAVLYRTAAQSRAFEEVLRRLGIRYRVVGGFSFYKRAEVKIALSYLRLVLHPEDDVALLRVLNTPPRGIGKTTVEALRSAARERKMSIWDLLADPAGLAATKSTKALIAFRELIENLQHSVAGERPAGMLREIIERSGYLDWIEERDRIEHSSHGENLRELVNAMVEAAARGEDLESMLDYAALVGDADEYDEDVPVSLMTLHAAKGLEFDAVFLAGLEEGLLPHKRSVDRDGDVEEERRLCYVGMTRARQALTLTRAQFRRSYGEERLRSSMPSRFLREIPGELVESAYGSLSQPGETRRYEPDPDDRRYPPAYRRPPAIPTASRSAPSSGNGRKNSLLGTRVRHPKLGVGTVLAIEGDEDDRTITISFRDYGTKKIKERYANLQIA
jgi:DNA helicase-2/ATP-dependent DNA helicase PcrA